MDTNEVLDWMIDQKNDHSIEEIDRQTLFKYIDTKEFLAVVFCKYKKHILYFNKRSKATRANWIVLLTKQIQLSIPINVRALFRQRKWPWQP